MDVTSNILDEIHATLDPRVWDHVDTPEPVLKPHLAQFIRNHIYHALETNGYTNPHEWLNLCLTGSLTSFQYADNSDCDVSLFVDTPKLPEWSRAEMIALMVSKVDGTRLPGAPYELQDFVVGGGLKPADLFREGLRSGYDIDANRWIVPPDPSHAHNVEHQENSAYVWALQAADKMERLLRYEPQKAVQFWHAIHSRRQRDQRAGKGDFADSNIVYKFLANRGLFPQLEEASGEHIAKTAAGPIDWWHPRFQDHIMPILEERSPDINATRAQMMALRNADELAARGAPGALQQLRHELYPTAQDTDTLEQQWLAIHPEYAYGSPEYNQRQDFDDERKQVFGAWSIVSDIDHQAVLDANAGQDLQGLPSHVNVPGYGPLQFHSDGNIQRMAQEYNNQYGIQQQQHPTDYSRVNPQIAQQVAAEFDRTPHAPNDPNVQAAYGALAKEVRQQYDHTINNGYNFEFYPQGQDPYPNSPREALLDLHHNKHMYVFPTNDGFGAEGDAVGTSDHPMLGDSGVRWNGQPVTHNDLFRAIHDVYGHAKEGCGFRADGEENAFRQHSAMFSPLAQRALTTETRGQNNWINYGPHGEQNQNANTQDTIFAQNRAGLMPEWVSNPELFKSPQGQPQQPESAPVGQSNAPVMSHTNVHEDHLSGRDTYSSYQPITQAEARGNSRPVSDEEFQQLASEGHAQFNDLASRTAPTTGLDQNWDAIKEHAWSQVQQPWGGTTVNAHTGLPLESNADLYALTARPPGTPQVSVPETADRATFHAAMDQAKAQYQHLLEREGHHIGAFHDDDQHRIDVDPIVVVRSPEEVERMGAYTRALGGAYHFATGLGFFPPHVPDSESSVVS